MDTIRIFNNNIDVWKEGKKNQKAAQAIARDGNIDGYFIKWSFLFCKLIWN